MSKLIAWYEIIGLNISGVSSALREEIDGTSMSYLDGSLTKGGRENSRLLILLDVFVTSIVLFSEIFELVGIVDRIGFYCLNYLIEGLRLCYRTLAAFFGLLIFESCLSLY